MGGRVRELKRSDADRHAQSVVEAVARTGVPDLAEPGVVMESWRRCVGEYKLDVAVHKGPFVVSGQELKCATEPLDVLRDVAAPEIGRLLDRVGPAHYVALLADSKGIVLDVSATLVVDRDMRRVGVCAGAVWDEMLAGTNGIGTALAGRAPVTVHRNEHFFYNYVGLTCTAAPIFNWDGELLGALDVSALADLPREMQVFVRRLVDSAARRIERLYFLSRNGDRPVLRLERSLESTQHHAGMLMALGDDGKPVEVLGQVSQLDRDYAIGRSLAELVDICWQDGTGQLQENGEVQRIGIAQLPHAGGACFASLRMPKTRPGSSARTRSPRLQPPRPAGPLSLDMLAGHDPALLEQVRVIKRLVDRRLPILLQGETGTGKEEFARGIHNAGARAAGPFVAIDCSSIPESLIESELFGYETGTFTGARREGRRGRIAEANGGTLFLDEIGDMPMPLQTRLLRVLAQRELVPLGASKPLKVDFNVICASHQDLPAMIAEGRFRQDLYFRIAGVRIELPALRNRRDKEGVILLALAVEAEDAGMEQVPAISGEAMEALTSQRWTGNIRELRLAMRYALANTMGDEIAVGDLPGWLVFAGDLRRRGGCQNERREREEPAFSPDDLAAVLKRHDWCVTDAAAELKVSRQTLYRWMRRQALERPN